MALTSKESEEGTPEGTHCLSPYECFDWDSFLEENYEAFKSYAENQLRVKSDAPDVVQECLQKLMEAMKKNAVVYTVAAWRSYMFRIIRNKAIDMGRAYTVADNAKEKMGAMQEYQVTAEHVVHSDHAVLQKCIKQALDALPPAQQEVVKLKFWDNMTFKEISAKTGDNMSTVASRYRYASVALGSFLSSFRNFLS